MKIGVCGCGRWGTFIAWYLDRLGNQVTLYGREDQASFTKLRDQRTNGVVTLTESMQMSSDLVGLLQENERIVISVGAQNLRGFLQEMAPGALRHKTVILCMKGIEERTGKRLTQVMEEFIDLNETELAIWVGPGHVQDFLNGIPNCMVIDSQSEHTIKRLIEAFSSDLIRFYYGGDLIGNEIGAATKNVIGIAAGMLDGLGKTALKGALMSRGTREVSNLIKAAGGHEMSAYGLCHLGDYQATVFSHYSHNRMFGEKFVTGQDYGKLAEGVATTKAVMRMCKEYGVEMPICEGVYRVLYEQADPNQVLSGLFMRSSKREF